MNGPLSKYFLPKRAAALLFPLPLVCFSSKQYHHLHLFFFSVCGLTGSSDGKESACNVGDTGSVSGSERSPEEGNMAAHSSILAWRIP